MKKKYTLAEELNKLRCIMGINEQLMPNLKPLKDVASKIEHCGDYGILFWNEKESKVFWIAADSDGAGEFEDMDGTKRQLTPLDDIESMFMAIPFVKDVEIGDEGGPYNNPDWERVEYD